MAKIAGGMVSAQSGQGPVPHGPYQGQALKVQAPLPLPQFGRPDWAPPLRGHGLPPYEGAGLSWWVSLPAQVGLPGGPRSQTSEAYRAFDRATEKVRIERTGPLSIRLLALHPRLEGEASLSNLLALCETLLREGQTQGKALSRRGKIERALLFGERLSREELMEAKRWLKARLRACPRRRALAEALARGKARERDSAHWHTLADAWAQAPSEPSQEESAALLEAWQGRYAPKRKRPLGDSTRHLPRPLRGRSPENVQPPLEWMRARP